MSAGSVQIYQNFLDLPQGYNALFEQTAKKSFYLSREWFELIFRTCSEVGDETRIYGFEPRQGSGEPIAALVMWKKSTRSPLVFKRSLQSMSNWYSGLFSPLMLEGVANPTQVLCDLLGAVANDSISWDVIDFSPLDPDDPIYHALVDGLRQSGMYPQTYFRTVDWYAPFQGNTFSDYWRVLSSKKRNTLRRKEKHAREFGSVEFRLYRAPDELQRALADYGLIYKASWKNDERYESFVPELITNSCRLGTLRLGIIYVNGEPAAAEFCIAAAGIAMMIKTAYVERFARLSVGALAIWKVLEYVLDNDRIVEIDFGNGDDSYKREWVNQTRERWGVVGFNGRTFPGLLSAAWNIGGRVAKSKLRNLTNSKV